MYELYLSTIAAASAMQNDALFMCFMTRISFYSHFLNKRLYILFENKKSCKFLVHSVKAPYVSCLYRCFPLVFAYKFYQLFLIKDCTFFHKAFLHCLQSYVSCADREQKIPRLSPFGLFCQFTYYYCRKLKSSCSAFPSVMNYLVKNSGFLICLKYFKLCSQCSQVDGITLTKNGPLVLMRYLCYCRLF